MRPSVADILTTMAVPRRWLYRLQAAIARCAICDFPIGNFAQYESEVCFSCLREHAGRVWSGCTRCGAVACGGACKMLGEFATVQSIYQYCGCHRNLLLRAKESQDPSAVAAFFSVYANQARQRLLKLVQRENVRLVVLPSVSVRRISSLHWHPADFWRQQIAELQAENSTCHLSVQMHPPTLTRKQALISSHIRRLRIGRALIDDDLKLPDVFVLHDELGPQYPADSVLFLDDVLTSGGTLLRELSFFRNANNPSVLQRSAKAHILTLFRTPVSGSAESHNL